MNFKNNLKLFVHCLHAWCISKIGPKPDRNKFVKEKENQKKILYFQSKTVSYLNV